MDKPRIEVRHWHRTVGWVIYDRQTGEYLKNYRGKLVAYKTESAAKKAAKIA